MTLGTFVDTFRLASRTIPPETLAHPGMAVAKLSRARIRYLDTGTPGPAVVIAPDPPNTIEHHLPMIEELRATHRVICFEMPGFGFSFPARGFKFTSEEIAQSLAELLDRLEVKNATLLFSCLASFAALKLAADRPDLVSRLVLAQAPSLSDALDWSRRMDRNHVLGTPVVGQLMMAAMGRKVADGWYRAALPKGSDTGPYFQPAATALHRGGCYCLASAFQLFKKEPVDAYRGVEQPVTVFWGKLDRTHRPSDPFGFRQHVPHADIQVIEDCGHFPDLEKTGRIIEAIAHPTA